ncbi:TPR repeat domain protein [Wolbachia endosymbiont of Brugia pahangi]|nr:TPR repeat domain protein [Wolbachia endosymbiont of Brugia pahangi]
MNAICNEPKLVSKLLVACAYLDNDILKNLPRIFPGIVESNSEKTF